MNSTNANYLASKPYWLNCPLPRYSVIDGYVWLDDQGKKGLGARLYDALDAQIPVIGVAKTLFATATSAIEVPSRRQQSTAVRDRDWP